MTPGTVWASVRRVRCSSAAGCSPAPRTRRIVATPSVTSDVPRVEVAGVALDQAQQVAPDVVVGSHEGPQQVAPADDPGQPAVLEYRDAAQPLVDEEPGDVGDVRGAVDRADTTGHDAPDQERRRCVGALRSPACVQPGVGRQPVPQEVGLGDDADEFEVLVDDRQRGESAVGQDLRGVLRGGVGSDGDHVAGHDVSYLHGGASSGTGSLPVVSGARSRR